MLRFYGYSLEFLKAVLMHTHSILLYVFMGKEKKKKAPYLELLLHSSDRHVFVCIWVVQQDKSRNKYTVKVVHTAKPIDVIAETIRRRSRMMGRTKEEAERTIQTFCHTYVLKVCGCDLFLFEAFPISQYKVRQKPYVTCCMQRIYTRACSYIS